VPVFDSVTVCGALVLPIGTVPKATAVGLITRFPWMPVPVSVSVAGPADDVIETVPEAGPAVVGENV
jgi:hypothetical protein